MRIGLGLVLALGSLQAVAGVAVEGLRLWRGTDHTRLVFDVDGPVRHSLSEMHDPERLVIDVENADLAAALHAVDISGTQVQRIRSGKYGADRLRIVLDLHGKVEQKSFVLGPSSGQGNRLIVDLFGPVPRQAQVPAIKTIAAVPAAPAPAASAAPPPRPEPQPQPVARSEEPAPVVRAPLPKQPLRGRNILVAIDAGHGGQDPGAIGPGRVREKDVVLAIARELEKKVNATPGYRATLVRKGDYFIPLFKRRDIARGSGADLFVSIHADAFTHARARGSSVYALSPRGATSVSAAFLAQRENGADLIGGVDLGAKDKVLASVLTDLSMTATMDASLGAGGRVLNSMGRIAHLHKRRVEQAGFAVLKSPDMPSILVETGFISNPLEAERLGNAGYQRN
ncbi:MAG: N-acetylmuramoyl-L-alanine amidase, partial [Pseudomonadales bacterium]|nr:N-acetylmuramoyl-L-alanine amidase [Pseudomonadales bacterium]